jgi:hypothetical protein
MAKYDFLDGERVRKAHSVRSILPIFEPYHYPHLSEARVAPGWTR